MITRVKYDPTLDLSLKHMPRLSDQITMMMNSRMMDSIRDPRRDPAYYAHLAEKALQANAEYLHPEDPPNATRRLPPGLADSFLWGPNGEWTGLVKTEEFGDSRFMWDYQTFAETRDGFAFKVERFHAGHRLDERDVMDILRSGPPYGSRRPEIQCVFHFADYREQARWRSKVEGGRTTADAEALAGCLLETRPTIGLWNAWLAELSERGRYPFGFGLLRDAEDHFDAWGVLAEMNGVEWIFDDREDGYRLNDGDAYYLEDARVVRWLGINGKSEAALDRMIELITAVEDGAKDRQPTIDLLGQARNLYDNLLVPLKQAQNHHSMFASPSFMGGPDFLRGPSEVDYYVHDVPPIGRRRGSWK